MIVTEIFEIKKQFIQRKMIKTLHYFIRTQVKIYPIHLDKTSSTRPVVTASYAYTLQ